MFQQSGQSNSSQKLNRGGSSKGCANDRVQQPLLLIIAPEGIVSDALTAAVERAFPWLQVLQVSELEEARGVASTDAMLILVDQLFYTQLGDAPDRWARANPEAMIALMAPAHFKPNENLLEQIASGTISGVLPTDVNLDIWLSIILIMLKGGEYFPPSMFRSFKNGHQSENAIPAMRIRETEIRLEPKAEGDMLENLTAREQEVLRMVAQGHQNKIIAADLSLSENTVKIHIHNIIRKLGVHNRTEAAALFFANDRKFGDEA